MRLIKNRHGLSLAELLIAIAIIVLASAISLPFYQSFTLNLKLSGAARDLASDLRFAQQLAVTTQINYQAVFYVSSNSYSIIKTSNGSVVKSRTVKAPVTIQSISGLASDIVTFNATGAASSAGTITLTNGNSRQTIIEIKPSGYVRIQ